MLDQSQLDSLQSEILQEWELFQSCQICGLKNPDKKHFYSEHKITRENYYLKIHPKKDLVTGENIKFTDLESYFCNDVKDRATLKSYLDKLSIQERRATCIRILLKRKLAKKYTKLPCHVELKSMVAPGIKYFDTLFKSEGGYYKLGELLGFRVPYSTPSSDITWNTEPISIIIDTREQAVLPFRKVNREIQKLEYGDYASAGNPKVAVERKSVSDFISSFGQNVDRLEREIQRAAEDGGYIFVVIEEDLSKCLNFNQTFRSKFTRANPAYLFHNVRDLLQRYDNIQFIFVNGRRLMEPTILFLLRNSEFCRNNDIQLLYESNRLPIV